PLPPQYSHSTHQQYIPSSTSSTKQFNVAIQSTQTNMHPTSLSNPSTTTTTSSSSSSSSFKATDYLMSFDQSFNRHEHQQLPQPRSSPTRPPLPPPRTTSVTPPNMHQSTKHQQPSNDSLSRPPYIPPRGPSPAGGVHMLSSSPSLSSLRRVNVTGVSSTGVVVAPAANVNVTSGNGNGRGRGGG
ncbi:hypothetical protein HDU76_012050, partial [Blyttiomyces sp. JEL0837]